MPRRRRGFGLGRHTQHATSSQNTRITRTASRQDRDNENIAHRMSQLRSNESQEQRAIRLQNNALRIRQARERAFDAHRIQNRQHQNLRRALVRDTFVRLAFEYESDIEYSAHSKITIGAMDNECRHCHALKFKTEPPGMCCAKGKVHLPELRPPPSPLNELITGEDADSPLFLKRLRTFNSCFQMTSFAASNVVHNPTIDGQLYETTFKVQGQVYHRIGSLMPMPDEIPKYLQIYFMGSEDDRVDTRCTHNNINSPPGRRIVGILEPFFQEHNHLIRLFKTLMPRLANDNHVIIIRPDKVPAGQHERRFNAPTIDDVAVIMVGDQFERRDIRIQRRDDQILNIEDSHRSYDALQYPLIFWEGEDGYYIGMKQRNPLTGI